MQIKKEIQIGDRTFCFETGVWAPQTNGSVVLRCGKAVLLVTVVAGQENPEQDFFPLTVEYRERFAGAGHFPTGAGRRELRASDAETLSSRLNDRSLRPLFPKNYCRETVVTIMAFSGDPDLDMPTAALNAASLALMLSDIPWDGPVAGMRIVRKNGTFIAFPTLEESDGADMNFVISVAPCGIIMVEGGANEVSEDELISLMDFAERTAQPILAFQREMQEIHGKNKLPLAMYVVPSEDLCRIVTNERQALSDALHKGDKMARTDALNEIKTRCFEALLARSAELDVPFSKTFWTNYLEQEIRTLARTQILDGERFDGRRLNEVRPLMSQVGVLPNAHGSAFFCRGLTQSLATCTLGGVRDALRTDDMFGSKDSRFFLHYNFPPYSVGEAKGQRGPGRREIGHGMLAQRALSAVIPDEKDFPYTIRVVSDILSSDGSSSMATVCGGCLALMDAGVPLKAPVTGIAMGLIKEGDRLAILTDIVGDEDHLGDMDFKVCGTKKGVTALQMDLKIEGLEQETLRRALLQAKEARHFIMDHILRTLPGPRQKLKDGAPHIHMLKVRKAVIGDIIGSGGANIRALMAKTNSQIDIDDEGTVRILANNDDDIRTCIAEITAKDKRLAVGDVIQAYILNIRAPFVRVELATGLEASLHFNDIPGEGLIETRYKAGDVIPVKVEGTDDRGNIRISACLQ
ncbi:MAG: polyribonucleotide nucleotidyltransferase [Proteobacteria bacterium]|nr:polyribonucleotide nucleotidyltransferase [Pseudomonadota bacterium]